MENLINGADVYIALLSIQHHDWTIFVTVSTILIGWKLFFKIEISRLGRKTLCLAFVVFALQNLLNILATEYSLVEIQRELARIALSSEEVGGNIRKLLLYAGKEWSQIKFATIIIIHILFDFLVIAILSTENRFWIKK